MRDTPPGKLTIAGYLHEQRAKEADAELRRAAEVWGDFLQAMELRRAVRAMYPRRRTFSQRLGRFFFG